MRYRSDIRVHPDLCRRLLRISRTSRTPVQKLINAILREAADEFAPTHTRTYLTHQRRSWRRR